MNPTVAQPALHRPVMDVARPMPRMAPRRIHQAAVPARPVQPPAPAVQAITSAPIQAPAPVSPTTSSMNIVSDIPLRAPAQVMAPREDDELDRIMRDVGQELKQADRAHTKKRFSLFGHKKAKPVSRGMTVPKMAQVVDVRPAAQPQRPAAAQPVKPATVTAAARAKKDSPVPAGIILVTLLVTTCLIAAAIYTFKQS